MGHPDDTELAAFLAGELPPPASERVGTHLDGCSTCRGVVERLTLVPPDVTAALLIAAGTKPAGDVSPDAPRIAGYVEFRELGRGGSGIVYRARDLDSDRLVAVKMLRSGVFATAAERAWFLTEVEAAARLRHPNIVRILTVGGRDAIPYYVMELAFGGSLAGRLDGTPVSPLVAARLIETVARAVHFAHSAGVIHRDLKPGNILLDDGPDPFASPRVADFGMAKLADGGHAVTPTIAVIGTPSYMAPEQAFGRSRQIGPAADVYSLGAVLYEMLTGRPPFKGETPYETLLQVRSHNLVWPRRLRPDLPKPLEAICLKCLEPHPPNRYPTALALAEDLGRFVRGEPVAARTPGPLRRAVRWARANRTAASLVASLASVFLLGFAVITALGVRAQHNADDARRNAEAATRSRIQARKALVLYAATASRLFRSPESITAAEKADLLRFIREAEAVLAEPTGDPDEEHDAAFALLQLADGLHNLREPTAAAAACRRGFEVLRRLAEEHPTRDRFVFHYSQAGSQLAGTLYAGGNSEECESLLREAIRAAEIVHHRRGDLSEVEGALASYSIKLAEHLTHTGRAAEAEERYAAAVAITRRLFDAHPEDAMRCEAHRGTLLMHARLRYFRTGDTDALLAAARHQLQTFRDRKHLHTRPDWTAVLRALVLNPHAIVALDRAGRTRDADELMDESLGAAADLEARDPASPFTRHRRLVTHLLDAERSWAVDAPRARESYRQAVRLAEQPIEDDKWHATLSRDYRVDCLLRCPDPALRDPRRALATVRQFTGDPYSKSSLGVALFESGEFAEAVRFFSEHIRWVDANAPPAAQVGARSYLARSLWQNGQLDAARLELRRLEGELSRFVVCEIHDLSGRDAAWRLIEGKAPPPPWQR